MKTHWKKCFNKDYLGSHDLDNGKDLIAVIDHVEVKEVKDTTGKSSKCNVALFKGQVKPMILNATNCKMVKKFTGSNYIEDWKDVPVQICIREVSAFGETVEALRIKDKQPNLEKPELTPGHEAWPRAVEHLAKGGTVERILESFKISDANKKLLTDPVQ